MLTNRVFWTVYNISVLGDLSVLFSLHTWKRLKSLAFGCEMETYHRKRSRTIGHHCDSAALSCKWVYAYAYVAVVSRLFYSKPVSNSKCSLALFSTSLQCSTRFLCSLARQRATFCDVFASSSLASCLALNSLVSLYLPSSFPHTSLTSVQSLSVVSFTSLLRYMAHV